MSGAVEENESATDGTGDPSDDGVSNYSDGDENNSGDADGEQVGEDWPGFGVGGAVAAVGSFGYLLKRRLHASKGDK